MKLILITLVAVVVGMMVACSSEPAATPTLSYPQISKNEAVALLKQTLKEHAISTLSGRQTNCHDIIIHNFGTASPPSAIQKDKGTWEVTWEIYEAEEHPTYGKTTGRNEIPTEYKWTIYPTTRSIARIDKNDSLFGGCP